MINDITIGQYFPGNSVVHKMDARMKIILTAAVIVELFVCKNFISLAFITAVCILIVLISGISAKTVFKSVKPLGIIIIITSLLNLFYGKGEALITIFGRFKITESGIYTAVFMSVRIIMLVVVGSMLTYTTTPTDLTDAIERLFKPLKIFKIDIHSVAMTMTIALRFIPTLIEEIDKITAAQKSRGADMDSGGLIHRIKALVPILIPLFISSFRRANDLAYAMDCRCYRGGAGRTKMKQVKMRFRDYAAFIIVAAIFAMLIFLNHLSAAVI
ncbi:MAG: energy-coupling factor transporter transmembrane protein EcfT [Clostridiales bacterium]|nr:energy-coupling factor transporter transmembrane protein EcfT [Clostridiales bacterium]